MIRLLVKGKPDVALAAARARRIEVTVIRTVSNGIETMLGCDDRFWRQVSAWLAEHMRAPFPEGSLMYFNALDPALQGRP